MMRDTQGDFPAPAAEAVRLLLGWARVAYAGDLVSVVVHGSLAFGCWGPASDIDVLIVVEDGAPSAARFEALLVAGDARIPGRGFELSVLSRTAALTGPHPIAYEYHYSRTRKVRPDLTAGGNDPDLAGHLLVAWTAGVLVHGEPIKKVLRRVRDEEFLASIRADVLDSCEPLLEPAPPQIPVPVYAVLNIARTRAWLRDGLVLSKRDGGKWLCEADSAFSPLVTAALDEYAEPCGRMVGSDGVRKLALAVIEELG